MRRVTCGLMAGLLASACLAPAPLAPPAEISIEILPGLAAREALPEQGPERVEVLLDVTTSQRASNAGVENFLAARTAAARFVRELPEATALGVRALGLTPGRSCEGARTLASRPGRRARAALAAQIESLRPVGEGSLAVALAELRGVLAQRDALERSRVVVFSDLGSECGGDLCTAAELLLDAGARLDFVVLGEAATPACFGKLLSSRRGQQPAVIGAPHYRVVAWDTSPGRTPFVLAEGRADAARQRVPAGPVMIELALDPPARIGPLVLSPGALTSVRVVEFPALQPPVREWTARTIPLAAIGGSTP